MNFLEDIYFFVVNTKYISSNVLKISVISLVHSKSEIVDILSTFDEIVWYLLKRVIVLFIFPLREKTLTFS